mgnify:FL=1
MKKRLKNSKDNLEKTQLNGLIILHFYVKLINAKHFRK